MDATEYVGRRAERALGLLPVALVAAGAVGALGGLVGLWRLATPTTGFAGNAAGSLWQRVTMAVATGYDVAPLAWGALALALLAGLARAPRPGPTGLPVPGPRVRRAAALLATAVLVLSVVAVVLVVVWAVLTRGEVSFSIEVPGDQDGGRVTTQVGTYVTDPWLGLVHVVPALVAAVLAGGTLGALLRPAPATERVEQPTGTAPAPAQPDTVTGRPAPAADVPETGAPADDGPVVTRSDPSVFARDPGAADRAGRGSGGAARFARSVANGDAPDRDGTVPRAEPASTDPLAGWTMGPGTTSDVAFRRPGTGAPRPTPSAASDDAPPAPAADANGSHAEGTADGTGPEVAVPARDPYRRPGA